MSDHSLYICVQGVCRENDLPKDLKVNCDQSSRVFPAGGGMEGGKQREVNTKKT